MERNMIDPQDEIECPQEWIDKADALMQEQILTSVDEEEYCNGDWTDKIYELACELWQEYEEDKKWERVHVEIQRAKDAKYDA